MWLITNVSVYFDVNNYLSIFSVWFPLIEANQIILKWIEGWAGKLGQKWWVCSIYIGLEELLVYVRTSSCKKYDGVGFR